MKFHTLYCTDFGDILLEAGPPCPTRTEYETRYDEFTGEPYRISYEVPDYDSEVGKKWKAYGDHLSTLAEAAYLAGGGVEDLKAPSFSEWSASQ